MSSFLGNACFIGTMSIIGLIQLNNGDGQSIISGEGNHHNEDLPHETVPLENEGECPPGGFH